MNAFMLEEIRHGHGQGTDGRTVLDLPRLPIPAGEVTALAGPNGSGKSTLLHLLALLTMPDTGAITLFGEKVTRRNHRELRRQVSLLLQTPYLFHGSVAKNAAWGLSGLGLSRAQRATRVAEALEWVGLSGMEKRPARRLSGGEGQRLALARLLARRPKVILLDEPTNHVDESTTQRIEQGLLAWVRTHGATVVLATHDLEQARRLGARRVDLNNGAIVPGNT